MSARTALVVSRTSALSAGLMTSDYETEAAGPDDSVAVWRSAVASQPVDAVILSLDPAESRSVLRDLRAAGCMAPALVIGAHAAEPLADDDAPFATLTPPVSISRIVLSLNALIDRASAAHEATSGPAPTPEPPADATVEETVESPSDIAPAAADVERTPDVVAYQAAEASDHESATTEGSPTITTDDLTGAATVAEPEDFHADHQPFGVAEGGVVDLPAVAEPESANDDYRWTETGHAEPVSGGGEAGSPADEHDLPAPREPVVFASDTLATESFASALLPAEDSPGPLPAETFPTETFPTETFPTETFPTETFPTDTFPTEPSRLELHGARPAADSPAADRPTPAFSEASSSEASSSEGSSSEASSSEASSSEASSSGSETSVPDTVVAVAEHSPETHTSIDEHVAYAPLFVAAEVGAPTGEAEVRARLSLPETELLSATSVVPAPVSLPVSTQTTNIDTSIFAPATADRGGLLGRFVGNRSHSPQPAGDPLSYDRRAADLARQLLALTEELPSTSGAAGVVLGRAMALVEASAGAVLLSDGMDWRVAAGAGLRALEWRLQLPESHWVVETVGRARKALVVADTDSIRGRLSPLPLSSAEHLLIAPLREVPGLLVLTRAKSFTQDDVHRLENIPTHMLDHIADALHVRALARVLDPMRDLP